MKTVPHAIWKEKIFGCNVYKHFNQAKVGLCLSAEEGAMFVSAEYLLCGLPVVTTPNLGGRNELFPSEFYIETDDNAEAINKATENLIAQNLDACEIRNATIEKMKIHREAFVQLIQSIYDKECVNRNFKDEWKDVFYHKLALRSSLPLKIQRNRMLK